MTRRRSSAPGPVWSASRRPRSLLLLAAALVVSACIGSGDVAPSTAASTTTPSVAASVASVEPTAEPSPSLTPSPTAAPTPEPTESPSGPTASGGSGSVDGCTGNDDNRTFLASVVEAVDWDVYCAVLPTGWNVSAGQYRLAGGGWMEIAYKGPGGARLELDEGAFCGEAGGCVPDGAEGGTASFGDRDGTLVMADDGSYAIVVDRGATRSWLAVGTGLELDTFRELVAGLLRIED